MGRAKSRALLDALLPDEKILILVAQRDSGVEDPTVEDLYGYGTASAVLKLLQNEDGNQTIIVHGLVRVRPRSHDPRPRSRLREWGSCSPAPGTRRKSLPHVLSWDPCPWVRVHLHLA